MDYKNYMGKMDKIYGTSSNPYQIGALSSHARQQMRHEQQQIGASISSQQQASPGALSAPFKITESLYTTPNAKNMSLWNKSSIDSGGDVAIASQNYLNKLENYLSNLLDISRQNSKKRDSGEQVPYFTGMWSPSINTEISTVMKEIENVKNYLYTR